MIPAALSFRRIILLCGALMLAAMGAGAQEVPWLKNPWEESMSIPAGRYKGPGQLFGLHKDHAITWEPGSLVEDLHLNMGTSTRFTGSRIHFRRATVGVSLWGRFEFSDSIFEACYFAKINPWYDTANSSTKWRLTNCVIADGYMGDHVLVMDCSIRAINCTFINMWTPHIHYRDGKVVEQAGQDWMKFERCRFVNCEIRESFLLLCKECVFENCHFRGAGKDLPGLVKAPFKVKVWWQGKAVPSYQTGNLSVEFTSTLPTFKAGAALPYTVRNKQLLMTGLNVPETPVILASRGKAPPKPAPAAPSKTGDPVTGTEGAAVISLAKKSAAINALLVVDLPGQGVAGAAAKLSALSYPINAAALAELQFNQEVGPSMQTALREVVKCLQIRHQGWPRGERLELSFADKFIPKDGPSAAVACALLVDSMLGNWEIDPALAVTGDLNADGSVQPVGGVSGKIRGATKAGCQRVALPLKNAAAVSDILVLDGPEALVRIEVFTIKDLDEAKALARKAPDMQADQVGQANEVFGSDPAASPGPGLASILFGDVRRMLLPRGKWVPAGLRDRNVQAKLTEIIRLQPNHLSAQLLLSAGRGAAPVRLTIQGSIEAMDDAAVSILQAIKLKEVNDMTKVGRDDLGKAVLKLKSSRTRMDPRILPALDALTAFGQELRAWQDQPPRNRPLATKMAATLMATANEANRQRELLMNNRDVVEELMK